MERLTERRTLLLHRLNSLSPTARLPPEILIEIFRTTCQISESTEQPITPLFFGGICQEWREIAWSTPLLWNCVSLHVSRKTHGSQVNLLGEWLLRAGTSPLFIKLTSEDEHESIFCSLRAIMDVLVTRSTYWHSLDCLLPPQCHDILKNNHFPMLTSVSVRPPKGTISTFSEPPNMFLSAPKLFDVDLSGYNFSSMVLPWEQLRRFKTQFLTVAECLKVLRRSPSLKECHLENVYSPEILFSVASETLYSSLDLLDVTLIKGAAITLLDSVTLPNLRDLRIQYNGPGGFLLSAVSSLVLRSSCNLQRLFIEKHSLKEDDLISCVETMPSLNHLRVVALGDSTQESTSLTDKLVGMLDPSYSSGQPLLPNLVSFEYRGQLACNPHELVRVFSDRCHLPQPANQPSSSSCRLKRVEIVSTSPYEVPARVQQEIHRLMEGGLHIELRNLDASRT